MQAQGLQYYDITIPANKSFHLSAPGRYFRFYSGDADGSDDAITLRAGSGAVLCLLKPGQSIKLPESVTDWYLGNYANAATISGIVVVGDGEIQDDTVTGAVSILDGGLFRTRAQQAFLGTAAQQAVAGEYAHTQLWNPNASGKNLIVEAVSFSTSVAGIVWVVKYSAALTSAASIQPNNKLIGGAAAAGQTKIKSNAALIPALSDILLTYNTASLVPQTVNFREPVVVQPGFGFGMVVNGANVQINANFEFFEEAI